jgi:hypothetical protein
MLRKIAHPLVAMSCLAPLLGACFDSDCHFIADMAPPAAGVRGEVTPRAALDAWLDGDEHSGPADGWTRQRGEASTQHVEFRSGAWTIGVIQAPAGGYVVSSVACT